MKPTLDYYLDDVGQIYLTPLDNLSYELIQADYRYGFEAVDSSTLTTAEIDRALKTKREITDAEAAQILLSIRNNLSVPNFALKCEGKPKQGEGFGSFELALILEANRCWLLTRSYEGADIEAMCELLEDISRKHSLFMVDARQLAVIDSQNRLQIHTYFESDL